MDLARLRSLQVDPLLDESIEPPQMLGNSLKSLVPNEQCPMSNEQ
jgi:hypothetical protein